MTKLFVLTHNCIDFENINTFKTKDEAIEYVVHFYFDGCEPMYSRTEDPEFEAEIKTALNKHSKYVDNYGNNTITWTITASVV